ncbi:MGH1-like glycoside hydrolase domain-containing protein [Actinophytocola oryzae]|uniref:Alpha-L-rhamnosidase-like protein n=1 Tax=Actinophytocola oryzae TaxID=502181 RepID=A0A4R7W3N7_9PSEU|nr:alpha-L-rhamnosidase C-terminal domain-containing protein [Actinophytocola oryzae]TDV57280.1 alpha-L-rhamnosidase-like protein [Actinophytocola oryzae]
MRSTRVALVCVVCAVAAACGAPTPVSGPGPADTGQRLNVPGRYAWPRHVAGGVDPDGALADDGDAATLTGGRLVVDFGVPVSGYVEVGVRHATGAPIRAAYAEYLPFLGREGDASTSPDDFFYLGRTLGTDDDPDGRADVYPPPDGETVLRSPGLRGSQRYVAISLDGAGTAEIDFVRVRQTNFPGSGDGSFRSSDPALDRAWYASAYAVDLSTIRTPGKPWVIIDGPKRDRVAYAGDLQVVARSAYYQGGGYRRVVRDTINLFACQQAPDGTFPAASRVDVPCDPRDPGPPDGSPPGFEPPAEAGLARIDSFTAWWVIDVADYLRHTGDRAFAAAMLPVARRAVGFFGAHTRDGLFRTDDYSGKPAYNWHPPDQAVGIDAYTNEAYFGALRALAELEREVGDPARAPAHDDRADQVRTALLDTLWDPAAGAMLLNLDDPRRDHSADANAGALLFGLLDDDKARSAMAFLANRLGTPYGTATSEFADNPFMARYESPYLMAQEALGRFQYGDGAGALALIRRSWTHMLDNGPGTPWEEIGVDGTPHNARPGTPLGDGSFVDLVHAWSTAIPALSANVLGVRAEANGWVVAPDPVDLTWARGDVPVPDGTTSVSWRHEHDTFMLTVTSPMRVDIAVPLLGRERTITRDGRVVWRNGGAVAGVSAHLDGDRVVFTGMTGRYTFGW